VIDILNAAIVSPCTRWWMGVGLQDESAALKASRRQWNSRQRVGADAVSQTIERTAWRYTGALSALSADERASLLRQNEHHKLARARANRGDHAERAGGWDRALREMARTYDG